MNSPKVSIVIPVYKAERFIEKCARSLFSQSLEDLEYVFVDDCGADNSLDIINKVLASFPGRKHQVKIIKHDTNNGVGQSRQDGIDAADGEYIIHCDPDDWIEPDMYEILYTKAKETDSDVVVCDYISQYGDTAIQIAQSIPTDKSDLFHQFACEKLHAALWNKLVKSDLAKRFRIQSDVNLWEDLSITPAMMMAADRIAKVDIPLYHYNLTNSGSVSHDIYMRNINSCLKAINALTVNLKESKLLHLVDPNDLYRLQWSAKKGLILEPSKDNIRRWHEIFPDSNSNFRQLDISPKFKFLTWLAIHNHYNLLELYSKIKSLPKSYKC